ncbi:hypothetical protein SDJN03_25745, partial [Cucurbita argyrosperma subsp. sororia]
MWARPIHLESKYSENVGQVNTITRAKEAQEITAFSATAESRRWRSRRITQRTISPAKPIGTASRNRGSIATLPPKEWIRSSLGTRGTRRNTTIRVVKPHLPLPRSKRWRSRRITQRTISPAKPIGTASRSQGSIVTLPPKEWIRSSLETRANSISMWKALLLMPDYDNSLSDLHF